MSAQCRNPRKSNFSQQEVDVLISTVKRNHDILYREHSKSDFHKEIRNQVWKIILDEVNKVSLERRTLSEIKNKWKKCQPKVRSSEGSDGVDYHDSAEDLDSMPLQQRLSQSFNQEPFAAQPDQESVLQSLALSPTKLKVTRQGKSSTQPLTSQVPPPQEVCLKWNTHHINMQSAFPTLLTKGQYVDATLVAEGRTLKCHKMILSSCSPYFEEVMNGIGPLEHPVLFINWPYWVLEALCAFMYAGEVNIKENQLSDLLNAATSLKIKGLATPSQSNDSGTQPIKQEVRSSTPTAASEKAVKEENDEEIKLAKHELKSKKKEDKRTKNASQPAKAKPPEAPLLKLPPRLSAATKTVASVVKPLAKPLPKPVTTRGALMARRAEPGRKAEKSKPEGPGLKEKDKDKTRPVLRKGNINDPLDLLQPVYEEIAKVPLPRQAAAILRNTKEKAGVSIRKTVGRRMKKRKHDLLDRDESPPPDLQSLKGTRSRPQAKVPKFFHSHFDDSLKDPAEATIVREPHTDQNDPLIGVEVQEIKAEPLDVDDNALELEESSLSTYMVAAHEMGLEGEEIIGNYDSPLVNIKREPIKSGLSKKELHPSPVIVDVHTVSEGDGGLLTIKKEKVEIVDIAKISARIESETFISTPAFHSGLGMPKPSQIIISHVQSMAEENLPQLQEKQSHPNEAESLAPDPGLPCEPDPLDLHESPVIPNSTNDCPSTACKPTADNSDGQPEFVVLQNHQHTNFESGSLGSLEGHLELVNLSESSRIESIAEEKTVEPSAAIEALDSTEGAVVEPNLPNKLHVGPLQACEEPTAALLGDPELTEPPLEEWADQEPPMEPMVISQNSESCELLAQSNCPAVDDAVSPESVEKIDKIEAELEECLASTSDLAPDKPMSFEDNEDFSKDIETFITKNNYLDYDFVTDVSMEGKNDCQTEIPDEQQVPASKPEEEAKPETFQNEDRINSVGNSEDFPGCAEDAQQFLADLDSDIIMDSVTGQRQPEKTLEMIVNDLNESLGE
ncbi:uncharacterized protein LOC109540073 isoform X2 [Dendroctonus ponderosae]|uniref:uncharacterized protein LOC109540073 isoform X2 n=1 Tax=Dendroctonus ponderosae TaxID=77166 RepID=UPI002034E66A|nr:uncharacterized protein LOC109540073 isoform X2 [Dendroctonus ponderosae]